MTVNTPEVGHQRSKENPVVYTPLTAIEVVDPADPRVDAIWEILSTPSNAEHLIDDFSRRELIVERIGAESGRVHLLAVEDNDGLVVGTATIVDQPQYIRKDGTKMNWNDHNLGTLATRSHLQSSVDNVGRVGNRTFEAVLKWAYEDSRVYGDHLRYFLRLQINTSIKDFQRMERIAQRYADIPTWKIDNVLQITHLDTGEVEYQGGVDYILSLYKWAAMREQNQCFSYQIETHPLPDAIVAFALKNESRMKELLSKITSLKEARVEFMKQLVEMEKSAEKPDHENPPTK